jgi:hypothetical protein
MSFDFKSTIAKYQKACQRPLISNPQYHKYRHLLLNLYQVIYASNYSSSL